MGGGSALLINSNRRGGGAEFGCEGWFCDVLHGAMTILVILIFLTAGFGCYRSCCKKKSNNKQTQTPMVSSKRCSLPPPPPLAEDVELGISSLEASDNPPGYNDGQSHVPPPYSTLKFDPNSS